LTSDRNERVKYFCCLKGDIHFLSGNIFPQLEFMKNAQSSTTDHKRTFRTWQSRQERHERTQIRTNMDMKNIKGQKLQDKQGGQF